MSRSTQHFILITTLLASFIVFFQISYVHAEEEYIRNLDLTVVERDEGNVAILKIGRHSPFRRYSWFRVGDVIEEVNGVKSTVYVLHALTNESPKIKYKRGVGLSIIRQIGLEKNIYDIPLYVRFD